MKNKFLLPIRLISLLAILLAGCSDEDAPQTQAPSITNGKVEDVTRTSATIHVHINPGTYVKEFGFAYSTVSSMPEETTQRVPLPYTSAQQDYTAELAGLNPNATYYYYFYAGNGHHEIIGDKDRFNTLEYDSPRLGEIEVSDIKETSFTLKCQITDNGGSDITQYGFRYRTYEDMDWHPMKATSITDEGYFTLELSGLKPATEYRIQAFAYNNKVEWEGTSETINVSTLTPEKPGISCLISVDYINRSILLSAKISDIEKIGKNNITEVGFYVSKEVRGSDHHHPNVGNNNPMKGDKYMVPLKSDGTFSLTINEESKQETIYYACAYAVNQAVSISYTETLSGTIPRSELPTLDGIVTTNNVTDNSVEVEGRIMDDGGNDITTIGFSYKTGTGSETLVPVPVGELTTDKTFKATLTGLAPNTAYQVRAYAINREGTGYSEYATFTTTAPVTPKLTVSIAESGITGNSIQVEAVISSTGAEGATIKETGFCWSTTNKRPTLEDSNKIATANGNTFALTIGNLAPETTYYIRAYAINSSNKIGYSDNVVTATTLESNIPDIEDNPSPEIK